MLVVVGEADFRVRPIAEGFVLRSTTPAERRLGAVNAGFGVGAPNLEFPIERDRPARKCSHPEDVINWVVVGLGAVVPNASIRLKVDVDVTVVTERFVL